MKQSYNQISTKQKEKFCFEIFESGILMGKNLILSYSGIDETSSTGAILDFVKRENIAKAVVENLSDVLVLSVRKILEEFTALIDEKFPRYSF